MSSVGPTSSTHRVAVLALDTVVPFELTAATHVFSSVDQGAGGPSYEVGVVGPSRPVTTDGGGSAKGSLLTIVPDRPWGWAAQASTLVVPGHESFLEQTPTEVAALVTDAWARGARVLSLGTGAFALAAAGVLDGGAATTHWRWAAKLAARHPQVEVRPEALFVGQDRVCTAAGAAAVVDVALQLIEQDCGVASATQAARAVIASPRRHGGQAQYLQHREVEREVDPVLQSMRWAEEHLADELAVHDLARQAHMSTRNFTRRFRAGVGTTPLEWLLRVRVRRAQELLERTSWSVDRVAHASGFGSTSTFREHFTRILGTTPTAHRRSFRSTSIESRSA